MPESQEFLPPSSSFTPENAAALALDRRGPFRMRFPTPTESEFRAYYRRVFNTRMQTLWYLSAIGWIGVTLADFVVVPELARSFLWIRMVGLAILLATGIAASNEKKLKESLHALTTMGGTGIGICQAVLFALAPFEKSGKFWPPFLTIVIVTTIFIATLLFEYSVIGTAVTGLVFTALVFLSPSIPLPNALAFAGGFALAATVSLSCTKTIEAYARRNFAQRRMLELQSAALVEKAEQLAVSERNAQAANLAKSVFLSNMSHELRTPLNAVLGFSQLLERDASLSSDGRETLKIIQRSGDHLLALINDVLAISTIEAGRVTLTELAFDLHEMIKSVADMIRVRTNQKDLHFIVSVAPDLPVTVFGDEGKLRQVLVNLLGNAVKFTAAGGIALRAQTNGSTIVLEVEDTGYGISESEIGDLFSAFMQTESGRKSKEGTGLGLAISRNFIRLMGGDIRVHSVVNRGTTFTIEVPLRVAERPTAETSTTRVIGLEPGQPSWRLLIVDDTTENRLLLTKLLTTVGFTVREATNGEEAIAVWREWRPDLIWMDMRMPVMDGYEATKHIRDVATAETTCKIIALTASAFLHDREAILANGCDDFVTKPFRETTIFEKLSEHLGARFLYEDSEGAVTPVAHEALGSADLPERLKALPDSIQANLKRAMLIGDIEAATTAVGQIQERDEPLAHELNRMVRAYRFDDVMDIMGWSMD